MELLNYRGIRTVVRAGFACLALGGCAMGQAVQPMGTYRHHRLGSEAPPSQSAPAPAPTTPQSKPPAAVQPTPAPAVATRSSLLDQPAQPARVDLAQGRLEIHADNSSLTEILHQLTADSGMTIDGLGQDQRIFGSYGPGDPQDVLSALLNGSGYNVVMVGRTQTGTPKELSLTNRSAGVASNGPNRPQQMQQDEDNDDEPQPQPASELPAPPPPAPGNQQQPGVRTPQQMLQELQQMRQQQLQQQQQQQQPPPQQ